MPPVYFEAAATITFFVLLGRLLVGDQLPTAREVVASTAINPNTVLKAYRELEREGLVEGRVGAGTFVTRGLARAQAAQQSEMGATLGKWVRQAKESGLARHEAEALMKVWLDEEYSRPEEQL